VTMLQRRTRGTIFVMAHTELQPEQSAQRAAERAGIVVRPLETVAELDECSRLITRIWDDDGDPKAPTSLLRALVHAGNFVAGAFDGDRMVGASLGFFGLDGSDVHLHSHITGVDRSSQRRSIGFALKQFQRSWALERGIRTVVWTADPLVRGNAFFNLVKLGAAMVDYHENFYGLLEDGYNAGDSDRVVVRWDLESERAVRAAEGLIEEPRLSEGRVVLRESTDGGPATGEARGSVLLAWVPENIVGIREDDPPRAAAWRSALRETVGHALADDFRAETITRDGWLVLRR
jgi:predicted GNAT superfamily acetyltransferase